MKGKKRLIIMILALVAGLGSCQGASSVSGDLVYSYRECADGWQSPSIGSQGACSHHGGVVTRTIDRRTNGRKFLCFGLDVFGVICLFVTLVLGFNLHDRVSELRSIQIDGDAASIPLVIAGETRMVDVVRLDENTYETCQEVALVKCPQGLRRSIYASKIKFRGRNGRYRQDLSRWIDTGRGRSGGYVAKAFSWRADDQRRQAGDRTV